MKPAMTGFNGGTVLGVGAPSSKIKSSKFRLKA